MMIDFFGSSPQRTPDERAHSVKGHHAAFSDDYMSFGYDYFDNPNIGVGYGGYHYDGRYAKPVADMIAYYELIPGDRVLELGCAKGYTLVEFAKRGMDVVGIDGSAYAKEHAHPDVMGRILCKDFLWPLPFKEGAFNLVFAKDVLAHVELRWLKFLLFECKHVSQGSLWFDIVCANRAEEREWLLTWDGTFKNLRGRRYWSRQMDRANVDYNLKHLVDPTWLKKTASA